MTFIFDHDLGTDDLSYTRKIKTVQTEDILKI